MSSYANQILTSLSQHNQMSKEASTPGEAPRAPSEGLSHMEKYAMTKVAFEWSNPYDDWIPFNEPDEGEEGYDPYQAALDSGDDPNELRQKGQLQEQYGNFGASQYLNPNSPGGYGGGYGGGYPYGGFGGGYSPYMQAGGMGWGGPSRRDMRQQRRSQRNFMQRQNPKNYRPNGGFVQNKEKRKAWRKYQRTEGEGRKDFFKNYGKDPAPAPVAPPADAGVA